jgi:import receptor subunit TOM70
MSTPFPVPPQPRPVQIDPSAFTSTASSSSLWDRISSWASENKAVVYTIAGVTLVVTAAGVYYYVSDVDQPSKSAASTSGKKKAKKDRRKGKKDVEPSTAKEAQSSSTTKAASVASGDVESELEELTEEFIASLSEQVWIFLSVAPSSNFNAVAGTQRSCFEAQSFW